MAPLDLMTILRKRWRMAAGFTIAIFVMLSVGLAFLASGLPTQRTYAEILFYGQLIENEQYPIDGQSQAARFAESFSSTMMSPTAIRGVVDTLDLSMDEEDVAAALTVGVVPGSSMVRAEFSGRDATRNEQVLSSLLEITTEILTESEPVSDTGEALMKRSVVAPPTSVDIPPKNSPVVVGALAAITALLVGLAATVGAHLASRRIVIPQDAGRVIDSRSLTPAGTWRPTMFVQRGGAQDLVAVRRTRDLLALTRSGMKRRLLVASIRSSSASDQLAHALARSTASAGRRVVFVDADPTRTSGPGLSDYLNDDTLAAPPLENGSAGLELLGAGADLSASVDLLASPRMASLVGALGDRGDLLVVSAGPAEQVGTLVALAELCDEVLIVVDEGSSRAKLRSTLSGLVDRVSVSVIFVA